MGQVRQEFTKEEIHDMAKEAAEIFCKVLDLKSQRTDLNSDIAAKEKKIAELEQKIDAGYEMVEEKVQVGLDGELHPAQSAKPPKPAKPKSAKPSTPAKGTKK
jgi:predicted  nucleic acid-binding Zn-ribbon protein